MSVTGLSSDPNRLCKNSFHWRNNSGELDVFEAARYFSGANENPGYNNSSMFSQNFIREDRQHGQRAARMSLDMPMDRNPINSDNLPVIHKQLKETNKKYKQPSSPGGRLASFLNSLFSQTSLKKKKKSKSSNNTKDNLEDESPGGRKRRSSISHFRITTSNSGTDSKSMYSSSSSGFITPPTYAKTPTKSSYKDFRSISEHQKEMSMPKKGENPEKRSMDCPWLDEEFRFSNGNIFKNGSFRNSTTIWAADQERGFVKFSDVDDGADTDSSSDLFDLPNHDLDLPVYGTTQMDRIRIGATISSATAV